MLAPFHLIPAALDNRSPVASNHDESVNGPSSVGPELIHTPSQYFQGRHQQAHLETSTATSLIEVCNNDARAIAGNDAESLAFRRSAPHCHSGANKRSPAFLAGPQDRRNPAERGQTPPGAAQIAPPWPAWSLWLDDLLIPIAPIAPREAVLHVAIGCAIGFVLSAGLLFVVTP